MLCGANRGLKMDYIEQSRYDAIAALNARIYEITHKIENGKLSMRDKLELTRARKELIEQRNELL